MTDLKPNLFEALAKAQQSANSVEKSKKVSFGGGYKYASGEDVIEEARRALDGHGLAFVAVGYRVDSREHGLMLMSRYLLTHQSGESIQLESETPIIPDKGRPEDKATATAKTYDLSYQLRGLLLLARVEEGAEVDARDDTKYDPKKRRPSAPEIQAEAKQPTTKRKVWDRIRSLRNELGAGEFGRVVGCSPADVDKWLPDSEAAAVAALASLEEAAKVRGEARR